MAALDTNVLVRFLVDDDAGQVVSARNLIRKAAIAGETLFIPVTVVLELESVLRSSFGFGKAQIMRTLSSLLSAVELTLESEDALELALVLHRQGAADFSDCLHVALAGRAGQQPLWTFDRSAAKLQGARLLAGAGD